MSVCTMLSGLFKSRQSVSVGGPIGSKAEAQSNALSNPNYDAAYLAHRLGASNPNPQRPFDEAVRDRYNNRVVKSLPAPERMVYLMNATKDHESEAEECLKSEFKLWLAGQHPDNKEPRKYTNTEGGLKRRDPRGLRNDNWHPTWWGNRQLTHLPGVREYLREEAINEDKNSFDMNMLADYGPSNLEEAWAYFKYWVKARPVGPGKCMIEKSAVNDDFERSGPVSMAPYRSEAIYLRDKALPLIDSILEREAVDDALNITPAVKKESAASFMGRRQALAAKLAKTTAQVKEAEAKKEIVKIKVETAEARPEELNEAEKTVARLKTEETRLQRTLNALGSALRDFNARPEPSPEYEAYRKEMSWSGGYNDSYEVPGMREKWEAWNRRESSSTSALQEALDGARGAYETAGSSYLLGDAAYRDDPSENAPDKPPGFVERRLQAMASGVSGAKDTLSSSYLLGDAAYRDNPSENAPDEPPTLLERSLQGAANVGAGIGRALQPARPEPSPEYEAYQKAYSEQPFISSEWGQPGDSRPDEDYSESKTLQDELIDWYRRRQNPEEKERVAFGPEEEGRLAYLRRRANEMYYGVPKKESHNDPIEMEARKRIAAEDQEEAIQIKQEEIRAENEETLAKAAEKETWRRKRMGLLKAALKGTAKGMATVTGELTLQPAARVGMAAFDALPNTRQLNDAVNAVGSTVLDAGRAPAARAGRAVMAGAGALGDAAVAGAGALSEAVEDILDALPAPRRRGAANDAVNAAAQGAFSRVMNYLFADGGVDNLDMDPGADANVIAAGAEAGERAGALHQGNVQAAAAAGAAAGAQVGARMGDVNAGALAGAEAGALAANAPATQRRRRGDPEGVVNRRLRLIERQQAAANATPNTQRRVRAEGRAALRAEEAGQSNPDGVLADRAEDSD